MAKNDTLHWRIVSITFLYFKTAHATYHFLSLEYIYLSKMIHYTGGLEENVSCTLVIETSFNISNARTDKSVKMVIFEVPPDFRLMITRFQTQG